MPQQLNHLGNTISVRKLKRTKAILANSSFCQDVACPEHSAVVLVN
jgi:hypothetical protein